MKSVCVKVLAVINLLQKIKYVHKCMVCIIYENIQKETTYILHLLFWSFSKWRKLSNPWVNVIVCLFAFYVKLTWQSKELDSSKSFEQPK